MAVMEVVIVLTGLEWGEQGRDSEIILTNRTRYALSRVVKMYNPHKLHTHQVHRS